MENKTEHIYEEVLDVLQQARVQIMSTIADILPFGGNIPAEDTEVLQAAAMLTGFIFHELIESGMDAVQKRPGILTLVLCGKEYSCAEQAVKVHLAEKTMTEEKEEKEAAFKPSLEEVNPVKEISVSIEEDVDIQPLGKGELFIEENRKPFNEFIFDFYRITVAHGHLGGGGKAEEMAVLIAPLKVMKHDCISVPIICSVYSKGRVVTRSSYDSAGDGNNMLKIDINEFYFLVRGSFDSEGKFHSMLVTTGYSVDQGDILNVIAKESHSYAPNAVNGHLKFKYDAEEGDGTIEIFPIRQGEDDFIIIVKNTEFVDYFHISLRAKGLQRAIIYDGGIKKEIICRWDGEYLEAEIVET